MAAHSPPGPLPRPVDPADALLAAAAVLPPSPAVAYALFRPTTTTTPHDAIELARRAILARNATASDVGNAASSSDRNPRSSTSLSDAILTSVHIGSEPFLYAFRISTQHTAHAEAELLASLSLDGLAVAERAVFTPPSASSLLPNHHDQTILSYFYYAVRARIIDDVVTASTEPSTSSIKRHVKRFKNGFLMSQITPSSDWEYKTITRPLIFCQLQIHFSYTSEGIPSHLLVHPMLLPTPFLDISRSLPLPAGTPITLLPYGTPAYYLASYTGPTAGLIKQFRTSLQGMGAGQWENAPSASFTYPADDSPSDGSPQTPTFIIGWIKVENKQGEDKGITIIYPTRLCLSYIPCSSSRVPLDYIPELPAPLQPSPQVAPALPSLSNISQGPSTPIAAACAPATSLPILASPTSESLHSFRALTLSKTNDLRQVASEVGGYVDAIARERERERERLKREREYGASTSPKMARTTATTPASASAPTPAPADTGTSASAPSSNVPGAAGLTSYSHGQPPANAIAGPSTQSAHPVSTAAAPQMAAALSMQNFYPSPPHTTPHTAGVPDSTRPTSPAVDDAAASTPAIPAISSLATDAIPEMTSVPPETPSAQSVLTAMPQHMQAAASASEPASYDMYGMDSAGGGASYLGLDMDMDMDFGMGDLGLSFGMDMGMGGMDGMGAMGTTPSVGNAGRNSGAGGGGGGGMSMEFEDAFTDDDFSFFDRPARPAAPPPAPTNFAVHSRTVSGGSGGMAAMEPSGSYFGGGGPGPPSTTATPQTGPTTTAQNAQMWTPGGLMDGMTPHEGGEVAEVRTPESTAGLGIGTLSAPATPGVHLSSSSSNHLHPHFHAPATSPSSLFEPIPFAPYHRVADGKYAVGKFAMGVGLPSPPASEEDALEFGIGGFRGPGSLPASPGHGGLMQHYHYQYQGRDGSGNGTGGWRLRYDAVTDPRIGVMRKLIGVKRKPREAQGARDPQRTERWVSNGRSGGGAACEVWETPLFMGAHGTDAGAATDAASEAESDEEEDDAEGIEEGEGDDDPATPLLSRPATPPPAYLPLGPTLLHTQFQHTALLPLSTPLRPPGASVLPAAELGMGPDMGLGATLHPPPSVPTPVSPAATMGAASEKSKSLESAAHVVGVEVVENPVWAETWRAAGGAGGAGRRRTEVWPGDCRAVESLLGSVSGLQGGMNLAEVFGLDSEKDAKPVQALDAPMISIGKGDAIIQVLPTALRFWEKLGLDPKGGRKDLSAFVLFEDEGEGRQALVETWLDNVRSAYQGKHFGTMSLGTATVCAKDGFIPLRFDASFRKSLASFVANLTPIQPTLVLFLVLPITVMSLSSPVLRQILSVIKRVLSNYRASQVFFQFIPEQHLFSSLEKTSGYDSALDRLVFSIYDRIQVPVDRLRPRRIHAPFDDERDDIRRYFMDPSFTIARPRYNKVTYVRAAHTSLDVLDRHTLLHVAYHLTVCGKWIIAACVDQRGEAYETGVWLMQAPGERERDAHEGAEGEVSKEEYAVRRVWEFAMQFARKANVEWRVVFARLGVMSEKELDAWNEYLQANVVPSREQPPLHHTLVCIVPDASWSFIPSKLGLTTGASAPQHPGSSSRSVSSSKQTYVYTDVSSITYAVFPTTRIPISVPPTQSDLGLTQSLIHEPVTPVSCSSPSSPHPHPQADSTPSTLYSPMQNAETPSAAPHGLLASVPLPHPITILPPHTSLLIRVPHCSSPSSSSSTTTISVHLLCTFHSHSYTHSLQASTPSGAQVPPDEVLLDELTRNYYELAVLAKARWRLDGVGGHKGLPFHLAAVDAVRMALDRDWERLESVVEG